MTALGERERGLLQHQSLMRGSNNQRSGVGSRGEERARKRERGEEWVVVGGVRWVGTWIPFFGFHRCCVYQSLTTAIMIKIVFNKHNLHRRCD